MPVDKGTSADYHVYRYSSISLNDIYMGCVNMRLSYDELSLVFKALSDETRLRTLHMLSSGELCACEILESFHITQPTLSYHMNILCDSGLVSARRDGAWVKYSLNREQLQAVKDLIDDVVGADSDGERE